MKLFYLVSLYCLMAFSLPLFGDETTKEKLQQLSKNGINLTDYSQVYTEHQYYLLSSFNFDNYRNYNSRRQVQIQDGPLILLYSLKELKEAGINIPDILIQKKSNEASVINENKVITLVNIGFRYEPAKHTETGF